ncbi:hypothetical protein T484DRAFT_1649669 [Baffinella frigidus]|nr:hypothetical protein T484DRAFT_1649669 [Cryptophyta sp. CCMP2293]
MDNCPTHQLSASGSDNKLDCACKAGWVGGNGDSCSMCSADEYCTGGATSTSCLANSESQVGSKASTDCICAQGWYGAPGGECTKCEVGSWCHAGSKTECPDFTSTASTGMFMLANCTCITGHHASSDGTVCQGCPVGTYKVNTGTGDCTECSANTFSTTVGASSENTCIGCYAGSSSVARSGVRTNCVCDAGYTGAAGTECRTCNQGTWKGSTGSGACTLCVQGTYSSDYAAVDVDTCTSCLEFSSSDAGSKSMASCKCRAGYYNTGTVGFGNQALQGPQGY